ncbi:hypothetical protein C8J57DRAFT_1252654 [Mycena rebaudengoi]|nr:hypothetical protein C8J57DRAFT_1252654 [Mycena rebaudengoi]
MSRRTTLCGRFSFTLPSSLIYQHYRPSASSFDYELVLVRVVNPAAAKGTSQRRRGNNEGMLSCTFRPPSSRQLDRREKVCSPESRTAGQPFDTVTIPHSELLVRYMQQQRTRLAPVCVPQNVSPKTREILKIVERDSLRQPIKMCPWCPWSKFMEGVLNLKKTQEFHAHESTDSESLNSPPGYMKFAGFDNPSDYRLQIPLKPGTKVHKRALRDVHYRHSQMPAAKESRIRSGTRAKGTKFQQKEKLPVWQCSNDHTACPGEYNSGGPMGRSSEVVSL